MRIETRALSKAFTAHGRTVQAVTQASVRIEAGETVGLLGDSGCGKSTLGLMLAGLLRPDAGEIAVDGRAVQMPYRAALRTGIQILFQHPEVSFDPRMTLLQSMREPYRVQHRPFDRQALCKEMATFGLYDEHLDRYPHELSGGELQRAALLRLLAVQPAFVVLDEPTSMLDAISQAQIMQMLRAFQAERHIAYLLITHNEMLARQCCHRLYHIEAERPPDEVG